MPPVLSWLVLLGVPGLAVGMLLGTAVRRWGAILAIAVGSVLLLLYGLEVADKYLPNDPDDDDPILLVGLAMISNVVCLVVGLIVGRLGRPRAR